MAEKVFTNIHSILSKVTALNQLVHRTGKGAAALRARLLASR
jgi:hypothetical protein